MNSKKGFTLIELMVVILIIGILAAVAVPIFRGKIEEQRYSKVVEYLQSNPCVKVEYSESKEEIYLVKEGSGGHGIFFKLNNAYFLELKRKLEKGEGVMEIWTFKSEEKVRLSDARKYLVWTGVREPDKELQYSNVLGYMGSNYCVKMLYSLHSQPPCKICLVRYDGHQEFFELNKEDFFKLKDMLKKGGDLGTWTFELVVTDPPGAPDSLVWNGTRSQKQKEI